MQLYPVKRTLAIIAAIALSSQLFSQKINTSNVAVPHTLLWRISGHGLKQSSYLFGTMHLADKRLFNFDDSVYQSIEKCEGLAIEVNPDEMVAWFMNKAMDDLQKGQKLSTLLSSKEYARYGSRLSKKLGKPADQITTLDITNEKNKWMGNYFEKGEMPTFVDTYLYNIARKQGKWVGGIEDLADQTGIIDHNIDNSDLEYILADDHQTADASNSLEKMITLYQQQDLRGISDFITQQDDEDLLLTKRNIKMARRMDSLSALRTMFFAVGAAHLAGESGVISLLKEKGFTVEPVFSKTKIKPENYIVKETESPWVNVEDKGFYKTSMPGSPVSLRLYGLLNMKFYFDIFNMSGCYTMALRVPGNMSNVDSMMNNMAKAVFFSKKAVPFTKISADGREGREFNGKMQNFNLRLRLFMDKNTLCAAAFISMKKEVMDGPIGKKFFTSLKFEAPVADQINSDYVFTDSSGGDTGHSTRTTGKK